MRQVFHIHTYRCGFRLIHSTEKFPRNFRGFRVALTKWVHKSSFAPDVTSELRLHSCFFKFSLFAIPHFLVVYYFLQSFLLLWVAIYKPKEIHKKIHLFYLDVRQCHHLFAFKDLVFHEKTEWSLEKVIKVWSRKCKKIRPENGTKVLIAKGESM